MRLVRQYALPWEEKGKVLKKLKADYETKQRQLAIAVKQLELVAIEVTVGSFYCSFFFGREYFCQHYSSINSFTERWNFNKTVFLFGIVYKLSALFSAGGKNAARAQAGQLDEAVQQSNGGYGNGSGLNWTY